MKILFYFLILTLFKMNNLYAGIKIIDLKFIEKDQGKIIVSFEGDVREIPEILVKENTVYISIPDSIIDSKIEKKFPYNSNQQNFSIEAYQFDQQTVKVRLNMNQEIEKVKEQVNLVLEDNHFDLIFPIIPLTDKAKENNVDAKDSHNTGSLLAEKIKNKNTFSQSLVVEKKDIIQGKKLDESYLAKILEEDKVDVDNQKEHKVIKDKINFNDKKIKKELNKKTEITKKNDNSFISTYILKFALVIFGILALFYLKIFLIKKGIFSKSKLSFLQNNKLINIIDNTYLGPKRSLITIKVNEQIFLLSSTETGINFISEIKSPIKAIKEAEKNFVGQNFDGNLELATENKKLDKKVKLKKDYNQEIPLDVIEEINDDEKFISPVMIKDKVNFSSQLKQKIQNLRPLN